MWCSCSCAATCGSSALVPAAWWPGCSTCCTRQDASSMCNSGREDVLALVPRVPHVHSCGSRLQQRDRWQVATEAPSHKYMTVWKVNGELYVNSPEDLAKQGEGLTTTCFSTSRVSRQPTHRPYSALGLEACSEASGTFSTQSLVREMPGSWAVFRTTRCKASSGKQEMVAVSWMGTLRWCPPHPTRPA